MRVQRRREISQKIEVRKICGSSFKISWRALKMCWPWADSGAQKVEVRKWCGLEVRKEAVESRKLKARTASEIIDDDVRTVKRKGWNNDSDGEIWCGGWCSRCTHLFYPFQLFFTLWKSSFLSSFHNFVTILLGAPICVLNWVSSYLWLFNIFSNLATPSIKYSITCWKFCCQEIFTLG